MSWVGTEDEGLCLGSVASIKSLMESGLRHACRNSFISASRPGFNRSFPILAPPAPSREPPLSSAKLVLIRPDLIGAPIDGLVGAVVPNRPIEGVQGVGRPIHPLVQVHIHVNETFFLLSPHSSVLSPQSLNLSFREPPLSPNSYLLSS